MKHVTKARTDSGKSRGTSRLILGYLMERPHQTVTYTELSRALETPELYVGQSLSYLINQRGVKIERPGRGLVIYRGFSGEPTAESPALEVVNESSRDRSSRVKRYLVAHPNQVLVAEKIGRELGLGTTEVSTVISRLKMQLGWKIENVMSGCYRYVTDDSVPVITTEKKQQQKEKPTPVTSPVTTRPLRTSSGEIFETVGTDSTGEPVIRGENGALYRLVRL